MKHYVNHSSEHMEEKPSAEPFHGFQMIRAVEQDPFISGLAMPEFANYVENMMKHQTRTEYGLKLVNKKLEKVLGSENNLQALPEPTKIKHSGVTLFELFQKTKMAEEKTETKSNKGKNKEKKTNKHLMRKMLKRRSTTDFTSADEKLHKILEMFYLEALAISQNMLKLVKRGKVVTDEEAGGYRNRHKMLSKDIIIFPYMSVSANQTKSTVYRPTYASANRKGERWIKSDAEYLILEL